MNTKNIKLKFLLLTGLINNNSYSKNTFLKIGAGAGTIACMVLAYEKRNTITKFFDEKIKTIFNKKSDNKKEKIENDAELTEKKIKKILKNL